MMLPKLLFYNFQSWRVKKFIEIQKNGWWKKTSKSTEETKTETASSEAGNATAASSSENSEGEKNMSETGSAESGCASATAEHDDENKTLKNIEVGEELKKFTEASNKEEREKCFRNRFWDRERNKADVSELMRKKKAFDKIELVNFDILQWFCDKWLSDMDTSAIGKKNKLEFYLWLEANYMEHLIAHQKHKTGHFTGAFSRIKKEAKLQGILKVLNCFGKLAVSVIGVLSISNFSLIINELKEFIQAAEISTRVKVFGGVGLAIFLGGFLWYVFYLLMESEHKRQKNVVMDNKGTWLRHQEAIAGYQKEMLEYIWETGSYSNDLLDVNRDRRLMSNMENVWLRNANKFQENMNKHKLTDG